jgi:hypothetical protein
MRPPILITAALLFLLWLASFAILLLFLAQLVGIRALVAAIVVQAATFLIAGAFALVSNTRRPRGIDPDAPRVVGEPPLLPDGRPYGRRKKDDLGVLDRLSAVLESEAGKRPPPEQTPAWAADIVRTNADGILEKRRITQAMLDPAGADEEREK